MIDENPQVLEAKKKLERFMMSGTFTYEQMLHVMGVLIDYYEKNYQILQNSLKDKING